MNPTDKNEIINIINKNSNECNFFMNPTDKIVMNITSS